MIIGVKAYSQSSYEFELITGVPSNLVINKIENNSRDKGLTIATSSGLYLITNVAQSSFLNEYDIIDFASNSNIFWIASGNKIINEDQSVIYELPKNAKITSMEIVRNVIWVGSNLGLYHINLANGKIIALNGKNSDYGKGEVNFIHKDKDNTIWIGSNHGSYRIKNDKWKLYEKGVNVLDYTENKEGMWFISKDDIWLVDYQNRYYEVGMSDDLVAGKLNDFTIDDKGKLYFSSDKLVRYNPYESSTDEFTDLVTQLTSVSTSVAFKDGSLYIGTKNKGLYRIVFKESKSDDYFVNVLVDKNISCLGASDASASAYPQGGQPPYKYSWLNSVETNPTVDGLAAGLHTVEVTDARGRTIQKTIQIAEPSPISLPKVDIIHPKDGSNNGSFTLSAIAGQKYILAGEEILNSLDKLAAGSYDLQVVNDKGCTATKKILLVNNKQLEWLNEDFLEVGKVVNVDKISFKADSVDVMSSSYPALEEIYQFMVDHPSLKLEIGGHTNTIPPTEYCDRLSTARAKNIADFFYLKGIKPDRLSYKGYGKRNPIASDSTAEGRRLNQRVELKVIAR
jgi:outer membrane protein OmpA-like peptidoglycan-associated protein